MNLVLHRDVKVSMVQKDAEQIEKTLKCIIVLRKLVVHAQKEKKPLKVLFYANKLSQFKPFFQKIESE